ncbi:MAG TPA: enolase C-terminal domain-like protein [Bryobacteraceae bacterium]|nr:enolase C-terminal domain-like protein [Bryobacteraceae bacterium]
MRRRELLRSLWATPLLASPSLRGLPPLTIKDVKVIATSAGRNYRWIFVKIITSEPGLYGIGSASNHFQPHAVIAAIEKHLAPFLIGKNPEQIEDLWQSSHLRTYWRNGPVNNNVLSGMDMALWDIKGKRAGMPVYELLGGKVRDAVPCYDHCGGNTREAIIDSVQKSIAKGFRHIRIQMGNYGGGGFIPNGRGGQAFDEDVYLETIPPLFEYVRAKLGFSPKLCHDVHSHLSGINAVEFSRRMQPYQMFFIEDVLSPEQLAWYKQIRQNSTTAQAVGELFTHPFEYLPLVSERLIDFVRCRVSSIGGITPARKLATFCEPYGVRTAFQEGGDNDPVNQLAAYHVDISHPAFGIQEESNFPDAAKEVVTGTAEIRNGYLYGNGKPGLGMDVNETLAAKYPIQPAPQGYHYPLDRAPDGTVVKP